MYKIIFMTISLFSMSLLQATDLFQAVESKNHKQINKLLKSNPDLDCLNIQGQTVLIKAVQTGNVTLVQRLLKKKAAVNIVDIYGKTALDYAVELNKKTIVKMLLKAEAMVTTESNAFMCKQLVKSISSINLWRIFAGLMVGAIGLCIAILGGAGLMMGCAMMSGTYGALEPLLYGALAIGCVGGASVYGAVKIAGYRQSEYYPVSITESAI